MFSLGRVVLYIVFMDFSLPRPWSKTLARNLAKNLLKNLAKISSDKLTENYAENKLKTFPKPPWSFSQKTEHCKSTSQKAGHVQAAAKDEIAAGESQPLRCKSHFKTKPMASEQDAADCL